MTPMTASRLWIRSSKSCLIALAAIKCPNSAHDLIDLRLRQLRIDRQRQHFLCGAFRLGAASFFISQIGETGLKVQRQRIVNRASDAAILEKTLKLVALGDANRVLIEDRLVRGIDIRRR